ncbi:MAG TPA: TnsD family transposase [Pyrinomonadaceae bacterium]|nr:TnsD family transposase [Pyrinomonadaceae bacterium]
MGLGHFPAPHPDELLYSVCARFSARVGYSNAKAVPEELFGTRYATATIDFPNNLGHLTAALPAGSSLTPERLINRHTILPFFSAFLPPERVVQIKADMRDGRSQAGCMRSGMMASRVPTPRYLRYCPVCVREDERRFREAYWHRTHQVSGVGLCPIHRMFLEESGVSRRAGRDNLQFIAADEAVRALPQRPIDPSDRDHQALLQVARDVAWLLEHPITGSELSGLHSHYLRLLADRGLATYTGCIHVPQLMSEFTRHYSITLLQRFHCKLTYSDQTKTNWLLKLVRSPKHAQHPLYHLLLIQFLGCTAEEFFRLSDESGPFGKGPWPCLNPTAAHYRQPVILKCQLGDRLRYGKPAGKFSCECGFAYVRTGPDSAPEDRFRVGRILSFGQAWETELKRLWRDSSLSISEIGRRLGVDPLTVRRHAARLELSLSRSNKKLKPLSRATQLKGDAVSAAREKKRRGCRSKWLLAMKSRREVTLKALRRKLPREYGWLRQNDSEWLERHTPAPKRRNQPTTAVDWKRRDAEYAAAVRTVALRLKEAPGRPVRVTRTVVGRALGAITLLRQKLHKMPLTAQVLAGVVETREQYAVRRVWWAADLYFQEDVLPREWQLVMRANVYSLRAVSAVKCAVEGAMSMLISKLSQDQAERAAS